jgi:hypothetical protein
MSANIFKKNTKKVHQEQDFVKDAETREADDIANFKSVCIHLSKNDYIALEKITKKESRSKMNAFRHAMRVYANNL